MNACEHDWRPFITTWPSIGTPCTARPFRVPLHEPPSRVVSNSPTCGVNLSGTGQLAVTGTERHVPTNVFADAAGATAASQSAAPRAQTIAARRALPTALCGELDTCTEWIPMLCALQSC